MRVIDIQNPAVMDEVLFGNQSSIFSNYFASQLKNISSAVADVNNYFIQKTTELYNKVNDSNILRDAKAITRTLINVFDQTSISVLNTIDKLQTANNAMQRWIMANPYLREAFYSKQRCDGYSNTYFDVQPGVHGEDHYDYRRVMSGVVLTDNLAVDDNFTVYKVYHDDVSDTDHLDTEDQLDILSTWDYLEFSLNKLGNDPTSIYNDNL